ncbi:MAG: hypothetical protein CMP44_04935 [Rickettsiales bacterium]|nr:hypothetical protein [Rickettsiales bacterium]
MQSNKEVRVSIIIPILNEVMHIEKCVFSVINSTKGIEDMELILVDGGSTDGTLEILKNLSNKYPFIKVLHNEKKMIGAGINLGILESRGKFIVRLDAHAIFPDRYIETLVGELERQDESVVNVGGILTTLPSEDDQIAQAIAITLSSRIGVGDSPFRVGKIDKPKFVSTVPFGAYRSEVFDEIGLFNEDVPRSEDLELSQRIINSGKKILMIPGVSSTYFSRADIRSFILQQFDNGRCVTKEHRGIVSFYKLRHIIPLIFTSYLLALIILESIFFTALSPLLNLFILSPMIAYATLIFSTGLYYSIFNKKPVQFFLVPLILFLLHSSYGIGSIYGILQIIIPNLPSKSVR